MVYKEMRRAIDKKSVKDMIIANELDSKYTDYFNKYILERYGLISNTNKKNGKKYAINLLKNDLGDVDTDFFFSFEILFLLKVLLIGANTTKSIKIDGKPKAKTLMDELEFDKELYKLISENQNEYGMYRIQHSTPFMKTKIITDTLLPVLNKLRNILTLLINKHNDISRSKLLNTLGDELNNAIVHLLILDDEDVMKRSEHKLVHKNFDTFDITENLSLDEQIVKHILIENTLGFLLYNNRKDNNDTEIKNLPKEHYELLDVLTSMNKEKIKELSPKLSINNLNKSPIIKLNKYRNAVQSKRTEFFNELKQPNVDIIKLIEQTFFDDSVINVYAYEWVFVRDNSYVPTSLPLFNEFLEKNKLFFDENNSTPYSDDTIKELLTRLDCYFVDKFTTIEYKIYEKEDKDIINTMDKANNKLKAMLNLLTSPKELMDNEKAEELLSLSIELITEEKEKSVRELDTKLKRLEAYKKNPIDFYNKFGLKQSEYTSSDLDKEIKDIQNSLITIIDGIKSTD